MKIEEHILDMCFVRGGVYIKVVGVAHGGNLLIQTIIIPFGCNRLRDIVVGSNMNYKSIERIKSDGYKQISLEQFEQEVKKSVEQVIDKLFCLG